MSNAEYRNTMADLLGDSPDTESLIATATRSFPSETESLGFRNNADYLGVSTLGAQGYLDAAEQFLDPIAQNPTFLSCTPSTGAEMDCARTFIENFGKRVFRRPLSADESMQYAAIFEKSLKAYDFQSAVRATAFAFLQSPKFLYRVRIRRCSERIVHAPLAVRDGQPLELPVLAIDARSVAVRRGRE